MEPCNHLRLSSNLSWRTSGERGSTSTQPWALADLPVDPSANAAAWVTPQERPTEKQLHACCSKTINLGNSLWCVEYLTETTLLINTRSRSTSSVFSFLARILTDTKLCRGILAMELRPALHSPHFDLVKLSQGSLSGIPWASLPNRWDRIQPLWFSLFPSARVREDGQTTVLFSYLVELWKQP